MTNKLHKGSCLFNYWLNKTAITELVGKAHTKTIRQKQNKKQINISKWTKLVSILFLMLDSFYFHLMLVEHNDSTTSTKKTRIRKPPYFPLTFNILWQKYLAEADIFFFYFYVYDNSVCAFPDMRQNHGKKTFTPFPFLIVWVSRSHDMLMKQLIMCDLSFWFPFSEDAKGKNCLLSHIFTFPKYLAH